MKKLGFVAVAMVLAGFVGVAMWQYLPTKQVEKMPSAKLEVMVIEVGEEGDPFFKIDRDKRLDWDKTDLPEELKVSELKGSRMTTNPFYLGRKENVKFTVTNDLEETVMLWWQYMRDCHNLCWHREGEMVIFPGEIQKFELRGKVKWEGKPVPSTGRLGLFYRSDSSSSGFEPLPKKR